MPDRARVSVERRVGDRSREHEVVALPAAPHLARKVGGRGRRSAFDIPGAVLVQQHRWPALPFTEVAVEREAGRRARAVELGSARASAWSSPGASGSWWASASAVAAVVGVAVGRGVGGGRMRTRPARSGSSRRRRPGCSRRKSVPPEPRFANLASESTKTFFSQSPVLAFGHHARAFRGAARYAVVVQFPRIVALVQIGDRDRDRVGRRP